MTALTNGAEYDVASSRKGSFRGRLVSHCDTWATLEITAGKTAPTMSSGRRDGVGETVTVRREWTRLTEVTR